MFVHTKAIPPRELRSGMVIVEAGNRGKQTTYPVLKASVGACASPDAVHVVVRRRAGSKELGADAVWCYDGCASVEVLG